MAIPEKKPASGRYRFSIRKKYSYEKKYKKVERPVGERIKEGLLSAIGRKPLPPPAKRGIAPEEEKEAPPAPQLPPRLVFRIGGLFAVLALLALGAFLMAQTVSIPAQASTSDVAEPALDARLVDSDIFTSSDVENWRYPYHTAYSSTQISSSNLPNITMGAELYGSVVPNSVFVLRSPRYQAESYPSFSSELSSRLSAFGLGANEISVSELDKLGAGAFLIVPSGYIPEELITGEKPMLYSLMERGVAVFYIGQDFSRMMSRAGSVVSAPAPSQSKYRINFNAGSPGAPDNTVLIKNPLYSATGLEGSYSFGGAYSVLSYGGGFLILAPQTLDGGWETASDAASDVSAAFLQTRWLTPRAKVYSTPALTGEDEVELFTSSFEGNSGYLKVYGYSADGSAGFYEARYLEKGTRGEVYSRGHSIMPGSISPTSLDLIIVLRESGGEKFLFLAVTNLSGEVDRASIAGTRVSLNSDSTVPHTFNLPTGDYIMNIVDQEGNMYARAYLRVKEVDIEASFMNMRSDIYGFVAQGDGTPLQLPSVTAKIDGGQYGTYAFSGTSALDVDVRASGYGALPDGMHDITFTSGSYSKTIPIDKRAPTPFYMQPFFLAAAGIAILAFAVAYIFKASEIPVYGLDIPDFPPQLTTKISFKKGMFLDIFEKVNQKYKWKSTPLKLQEIKGAFKGMLHEGKPVFISDYNLEYLLDQLVGLGLLRKEAGYYARASWEEETGTSAKYLAMFRSLRDICINEAVPFTQLGSSDEYDSKITILGQDIFLHFYEGPETISRVMGSLHNGLNMILTEDEGETEELNEFLASGGGAATLLKLEVESGSVQIKTLEGLQQMIREMKV